MIALKPEELRTMLSRIDVKAPMGPRNYFMLVLLYNTGLRVSELAGLNVHDVACEGAPEPNSTCRTPPPKATRAGRCP